MSTTYNGPYPDPQAWTQSEQAYLDWLLQSGALGFDDYIKIQQQSNFPWDPTLWPAIIGGLGIIFPGDTHQWPPEETGTVGENKPVPPGTTPTTPPEGAPVNEPPVINEEGLPQWTVDVEETMKDYPKGQPTWDVPEWLLPAGIGAASAWPIFKALGLGVGDVAPIPSPIPTELSIPPEAPIEWPGLTWTVDAIGEMPGVDITPSSDNWRTPGEPPVYPPPVGPEYWGGPGEPPVWGPQYWGDIGQPPTAPIPIPVPVPAPSGEVPGVPTVPSIPGLGAFIGAAGYGAPPPGKHAPVVGGAQKYSAFSGIPTFGGYIPRRRKR